MSATEPSLSQNQVNAVRGQLPRRRVGTRRRSAKSASVECGGAGYVVDHAASHAASPLACQLHNLAVHENTHSDQATLNEQQHVRTAATLALARWPLAQALTCTIVPAPFSQDAVATQNRDQGAVNFQQYQQELAQNAAQAAEQTAQASASAATANQQSQQQMAQNAQQAAQQLQQNAQQ